MNQRTSQIRKKGTIAGLALLLMACPVVAKAAAKKKGPAKPVNLVWPLPPEKPRIKYVTSISGAEDVEPVRKAGFLDRVAGIQRKGIKPGFEKPHGVATDSHGRIYVTDSAQGMVFVLDRANKRVSFIGSGSQVNLRVPLGITVDARDRVWVADAVAQHVYAFDADGNPLMVLGKQGELENPTSVALDEKRHRLFVVDSKKHCVVVYDSESGQRLDQFGQRGLGKGEFNFPTHVVVDQRGRIYVSDTMNFRVQIFDAEYRFVDSIGSQGNRFGQFLKPKGLALDSYQNLYVVDSDFANLQVFDQQKRLLMFLGSGGEDAGMFLLPCGIHIDSNNNIYVTDQNNRRVQIFQLLDGTTEEPATRQPQIATVSSSSNKGGETGVTKQTNSDQVPQEIKQGETTP